MADNTTLNVGSGGDVIATDDIGGVKYQWVKAAFGVDGAVVPVSTIDPLPVTGSVANTLAAGSLQSAAIAAVNDALTIATNGAPAVAVQTVAGGTLSGTVLIEGSVDGGTTYGTMMSISGSAIATTAGTQLSTNANPSWVNAVGMSHVRFRCSAYTSGTSTIVARTSNAAALVHILNGALGSISTISGGVVPGTAATNLGKAEDAVHTSGDTGVAIWGVRSDAATTLTSADGDYSPIAVNPVGAVAAQVKPTGSVAWAFTQHRLASAAAGVNATNVKSGGGNLYGIYAVNVAAAVRYLKFYNKATAPTVGTDAPVWTILLPATSNTFIILQDAPRAFATGIGYGLTVGAPDGDTAGLTAGDVIMTLDYF